MSTKDYVYLALIALSALVFYLHGYYAGASRRRHARRFDDESSTPVQLPEPVVFTITVEDLTDSRPHPTNRIHEREPRQTVQCVFGHN